ncbi:MAG: alpha/beta fold hydrolase [Gemmatimonadota bacterium]
MPEAAITRSADGVDRAEYPFVSRRIEVPAGRLHYIDEGSPDAPVLFFVHGTPTWSFEWRHLVRSLRQEYRCIAVDHLGFGLSDRPRSFPYTPEAHAENLRHFIDKLAPPRFTLIVHDYGGPIAFPLALQDASPVERLVILNSWMWSFRGDRRMERAGRMAGGTIGRFLYRYANASQRIIMPSAYADRRKLTPEIHAQYLDRFADTWSRGAVLWPLAHALLGSSTFYDSLWKQRERLKAIPTLIIWGMKDSAFQPDLLQRWRDALPHAHVVELASAGHWPHEEDAEATRSALYVFLRANEREPVIAWHARR